jgi:hypothetical protein
MPTTTATISSGLALALGGVLLAVSAYFVARPGAKGSAFGWAVVSGLAAAIVAMAAAVHTPASDGFTAAMLHLVTVALAGALAALSLPPRDQEPQVGGGLGAVGRGVAWLTLVGLPPTLGFHAKVMLYRAALTAGWGWVMLLTLAVSLALLLGALREIRAPLAGPLRGARAISVMALIGVIIILGFYPYLWLIVHAITGNLTETAMAGVALMWSLC